MPVEFIGMISTQDQSETRPSSGPVIDKDYVRRFAQAHEDAGFDRVLIGYNSSQPDGTQVAAYAAAHTERLGFLVAHRPGFMAPTLAARTFATLDQFTGGRAAVHVITGGSDAEQRRDGDYLSKDERYHRTDEYLDILTQAWTSEAPFGYRGHHYRFEDFHADVRPVQQPRIPLYFGGSSEAAYRAEPPRISVSFRPILGATEELAWERAHRILAAAKANVEPFRRVWRRAVGGPEPQNRGSQRGRQLHRPGRDPGHGGASAARLHRHRRVHPACPGLRPLRRRRRLRSGPASPGAGRNRSS